jgi:hypothetical protein
MARNASRIFVTPERQKKPSPAPLLATAARFDHARNASTNNPLRCGIIFANLARNLLPNQPSKLRADLI